MRILVLEPFHGGSHRAFLDGWQTHSKHHFTVLGLPAYKWKWRMRHASLTLAQRLRESPLAGQEWDVVWCSDMLNLPEFLGLAPPVIRSLPSVAYFHENQLTYPVQREQSRDLHFAYSNFLTATAADQVWFNSQYHMDDFLSALARHLPRMPDYQHADEVHRIRAKARVAYPGVGLCPRREVREPGPIRILWNARWEHDKNPEDFFAAIKRLKQRAVAFRLLVVGESFRNSPTIFEIAKEQFADEIEQWGYAESRSEYESCLRRADVVVSTAKHEFFGIGVVEAVAAGAIPIVPNRLAYPEVAERLGCPESCRYDGSVEQLVVRLQSLSERVAISEPNKFASDLQAAATFFGWNRRAQEMDAAMDELPHRP